MSISEILQFIFINKNHNIYQNMVIGGKKANILPWINI